MDPNSNLNLGIGGQVGAMGGPIGASHLSPMEQNQFNANG